MNELPIVLHVGAAKAGSSALQHDLTWSPMRPLPSRPGTACEYMAIDSQGQCLRGDALDAFATLFAARYAMSAAIEDLVALPDNRLRGAMATLCLAVGAQRHPALRPAR